MPRTRRAKPQLSESWEAVESIEDQATPLYSRKDERDELGDSYKSGTSTQADMNGKGAESEERTARRGVRSPPSGQADLQESTPRKRATRSDRRSEEPELIMPSSPSYGGLRSKQNLRASTPHFRNNQRSFTSDAGTFRSTPGLRHTKEEEHKGQGGPQQYLELAWSHALRPLLFYALSILGTAWNIAAPFAKYIFAIWLIVGIGMFVRNFLVMSMQNALSPICKLPMTSYLSLPFCPGTCHVALERLRNV